MDSVWIMATSKGFGKAQPKKDKGAFSHFWVVDSEVWTFDNKGSGTIKPYKTTNQYKSDEAGLEAKAQELDGKEDGFYKFGVHKESDAASWKFEELSVATKRSINATKALIESRKSEIKGKQKTVFG